MERSVPEPVCPRGDGPSKNRGGCLAGAAAPLEGDPKRQTPTSKTQAGSDGPPSQAVRLFRARVYAVHCYCTPITQRLA